MVPFVNNAPQPFEKAMQIMVIEDYFPALNSPNDFPVRSDVRKY